MAWEWVWVWESDDYCCGSEGGEVEGYEMGDCMIPTMVWIRCGGLFGSQLWTAFGGDGVTKATLVSWVALGYAVHSNYDAW